MLSAFARVLFFARTSFLPHASFPRIAPVASIALGAILVACSSAPIASNAPPAKKSTSGNGAAPSGTSSGNDADGSVPIVDAPDVAFQVMPLASFSGYDGGQHSFKVPIAVYGGGSDLSLASSDPDAVAITPMKLTAPGNDQGRWFFLETKKATVVTLTATSGSQTATTRLTIKSYDAASYDTGKARYMNGSDDGTQPACTQCHDASNGGIDHSPATMGSSDDTAVETIITTGVVNEHPITSVVHKWQATPDELSGLVTYLRALDPRGFETE